MPYYSHFTAEDAEVQHGWVTHRSHTTNREVSGATLLSDKCESAALLCELRQVCYYVKLGG